MSSRKGRTQRKEMYVSSLHVRKRYVHAHLSKELRKKLGTEKRSLQVRKGDKVKIVRGSKKGHEGKVIRVDLSKRKIYIEGITLMKARKAEAARAIDPSNVMIIDASMEDKMRKQILGRAPAPKTINAMDKSTMK